VLKQLRKWHK